MGGLVLRELGAWSGRLENELGRPTRRDRHSALGGDIGDRFGERPHVARRVLCRVVVLAELKILQLGHDPRPLRLGPLAGGGRIFDPYHHRVSDLAWSRRPAVFPYVSDDDGSHPKGELRAVVVADPGAFDEAGRSAKPVDRLAHVRVDDDGDHGRLRDRAVALHA